MTLDVARSLARRIRPIEFDEADRLDALYLRLFARSPSKRERADAMEFLTRFGAELNATSAAKPKNSRNVAYRHGEKIEWDAETMRIPNALDAENYLQSEHCKGWKL